MAAHQSIALGSHTGSEYTRLVKVGFSHRQIQYLLSVRGATARRTYRDAFSARQIRALDGADTMAVLLKGGFTRPQAKVLLALSVA